MKPTYWPDNPSGFSEALVGILAMAAEAFAALLLVLALVCAGGVGCFLLDR